MPATNAQVLDLQAMVATLRRAIAGVNEDDRKEFTQATTANDPLPALDVLTARFALLLDRVEAPLLSASVVTTAVPPIEYLTTVTLAENGSFRVSPASGNNEIQQYYESMLTVLPQLSAAIPATRRQVPTAIVAERRVEELEAELSALKRETSAQRTELTVMSDAATAAVDEQSRALAALDAARVTKEAEFDAAIADRTKTFHERFTTFRSEEEARATEIETRFTDNFTAKQKELDSIVGAAGNVALSHNWRAEADEHKQPAFRWSVAVIVLGFCAVAAIMLGFLLPGDPAEHIATRFFLTTSFASLAVYAGTQAKHHRDRERTARRINIELAAFPSYLHQMDPADAKRLRAAYADRFFQGHYPSGAIKPSEPAASEEDEG